MLVVLGSTSIVSHDPAMEVKLEISLSHEKADGRDVVVGQGYISCPPIHLLQRMPVWEIDRARSVEGGIHVFKVSSRLQTADLQTHSVISVHLYSHTVETASSCGGVAVEITITLLACG